MRRYSKYLQKYASSEKLIVKEPSQKTHLIVVIPAFDEESVLMPLISLQACELSRHAVEVIVVFNAAMNASADIKATNMQAMGEAKDWFEALDSPNFQLHLLVEHELPPKHAGVGLARKIGMDEAVRRFEEIENEEGIILCFDADSQCESNYLIAIEEFFELNPQAAAASIHFEHPLEGEEYREDIYKGIYYYELHLRYYKNGLAFANLPYAYHTIGSSMAVRARAYCEEGGMNKRKAGEDFYFLQKFANVGGLYNLNTTKVIPSSRASHRVPFGTGKAIQEMLDNKRVLQKSYAFQSFQIIKDAFEACENWYHKDSEFHPQLIAFVGRDKLIAKIDEIRSQSTNVKRFKKRLFQWFNAFQALKFVHFLRDDKYEIRDLDLEVPKLIDAMNLDIKGETNLEILRKQDQLV